jgi:ABC-2 type transport system permease protein
MLKKELTQVLRDKRTRILLIGPPLLQTLIFGYAATLEIKHVPTAIIDYDNTQVSRDLVSRFEQSRYFDVRAKVADRAQLVPMIDRSEVLAAIQINSGFAEDIRKGQTAKVQVVVDSSNSNTALVALGYINQVAARMARDYQMRSIELTAPGQKQSLPQIALETRPWFNPDLSAPWFFVPGVIGNITMIVVLMLTAFAVVREREIGTLEQIMVTPISRFEFIVGKTVPFFLVGFMNITMISLVGTLWFQVPLRGSLSVLALGASLFLLSALGVGLLISTICSTQQQAMISGFFFVMPAIVLSGFGSPISSMPQWLQYVTYINPLRYFMVILRSVYLKGVGLDVLWPQMLALLVLSTVILGTAVLRFSKSLD